MPVVRVALLVVLLVAVHAGFSAPVMAQYFGQNVVRYQRFDFQVLETEHFDIYYYYPKGYEGADVEVQRAALIAERWHARLSKVLLHDLSGRQPLILYANHPQFRQTNAIPGGIGEGTGGVTEVFKRRIVLPFGGSLAATDHVIGHELVHAFQFDMTGERGVMSSAPGALALPLWFVEGMAEYLSIGPVDPLTAMWMRDAVLREELPTIQQLDDPQLFPYRWGHAFWAYVAGEYGDDMIGPILVAAGLQGDALLAIEHVLSVSIDELTEEWHRSLRDAYEPIVDASSTPDAVARAVLTSDTSGGRINIAPAVSPDGSRVVFLSERDLFSIDMYLADAADGRIIRKLVDTAVDPHYDSLQFINSAGGWHPDGRLFVFAAVARGQPVLTIVDTQNGVVRQEIELKGLGAAYNPAFSPDGGRIAFSANVTGVTNLFVYDRGDGSLRRLTDDGYAALAPAWSPDGRTLAFATDRFTTDLETLRAGPLQIAVVDVESGAIRRVAGFPDAESLNPQWSRDGASLFFVASREGIPNIYRTDVAGGATQQVTDLVTGVSGITAESPALSVAAAADRLLFSAFDAGEYDIYAIDGDRMQGQALATVPDGTQAAVLPPRTKGDGAVHQLLQEPQTGLPANRAFQAAPYNAGLSLDFVGQPILSAGADQFGTYFGGGVSFVFSDMLGNHRLVTAAQINGGLRDIGALVGYQNATRRINWGVVLQRVPLRTGAVAQEVNTADGEAVLVERVFFDREIHNNLSGIVSYPFSRATRMEFSGGVTHLSFDREVDTRVISLATGGLLFEEVGADVETLSGLTLGQASAALVYDTAIFGATGPILGRRARFEFGRAQGDISFSSALLDYRQYEMPFRPFTFAGRLLHLGRYGPDADDPRLLPYFIGYQSLVRGYDIFQFTFGGAGVLNRLTGSRILVGNLEMRFPLLGLFTRTFYGPFPVEGIVFADAGSAWDGASRPRFLGGDIAPVTSAGVGVRASLLGFAVIELDLVRPFDRIDERWVWQFGFSPGF